MKAAQNRSGYERVGAGSLQSGTGIDRRAYALYPPSSRMAGLRRTGGLTKDEIKLVEGQTQ